MNPLLRSTSPRVFNRTCAAITLGVIVVSHLLRGPSYQDFPQYYMGGLVVRAGAWDALYPQVRSDGTYNAGWAEQSMPRDAYLQLAREHGLAEFGAHGVRFIHSPPVALALAPLAWFSYTTAHWIWIYLLAICMFAIALQAGRIQTLCAGEETRAAGVVTLVVGCSLLAYRAVRVGNVSPIVALCLGTMLIELAARRGTIRGGAAMVAGALLKYTTPVLAPLYIVAARWRALILAAIIGTVVVLATLPFSGTAPFCEWVNEIAPTLGRSHPIGRNQSLPGLMMRLGVSSRVALSAIQWLTLLVILILIARNRRALRDSPPVIFAAGAALISWLLVFGPLFWEHYAVYLCPIWGWLAWEAAQRRWRLILATVAIALVWVPLPTLRAVTLPEPLNSSMLISTAITLALAIVRLAEPPHDYAAAQ